MKKGYINWKLVLVLVLGFCAVGVTVVGLRKFNRTQRAEQGLKQGLQAYDEKRWLQAASGLGQYLGVHQSDVEILLKYGHAQSRIQPFKREHFNQAINAYRAVLRIDEVNLDAARSLVELYLQARLSGEAELVASRFLEKQYDGQITLRLAAAQMMQRKYETAAQLLTEMLNREPSDVTLYELLANIAQERPDLLSKTPREWVEMAVANNPQDAQVYILRAKFLTNSGQHEEAKLSLQQAVGCDVSDIKIRLSLAAAWLRLDMTERAEEQLVIVDAEDTTLPELWQLRAVAAAKIGDPVKSAQVARDGLDRLGDGKAGFLPYAVELFLLAGDTESARLALKDLRSTDTSSGLVCYLDGLLAERDGDWSRAMAQWREAVVQGYTTEPVYLKLAEGAVRLEDRTSAIETLRRYINQNPNSFSAQLLLAQVLSDSRQWAEASQYAAAAVRLNPASKEAQSLLSRCRIESLSAQPQSQGRVDQLLAELIAQDDSMVNHLLAFRIVLGRQDWPKAQQTLEVVRERYGPSLQLQMAQAELHVRRGQTEQAIAVLEETIRLYPDASEPVILRAALFVDQQDISGATNFMRDAVSRLKGSHQRKSQLWLADLYRQTNRKQDAIELFTAMASSNPQDILPRRQLLALNRTADADAGRLQTWIDEIKKIEGDTGRFWKIEQVSLWMTLNQIERLYTEAVSLLNENIKANPDDKQSLMLLAAIHEQVGNVRLAVSLYRDTLTRHPDDVDLAIAAMGAMYRAEEYRQAEQLLADLLAAGHSDPRLAHLELQSHIRQGKLDSAEDLLEKMVLRNVHDSSAKLSLAMLKTRNGEFADARKLIDELIMEKPDAVVSYAALVDWHLRQDQPQQAVAVCDEYLRRHDTIEAHRLQCHVMLALNEKEKAIEIIEKILEHFPNNPELLLGVCELYIAAGLQDQALDVARRALSIEPDSFEAQKQGAMLMLSRPPLQQEGMVLLEKAVAQQPRDAQLRLQKASLLLGRGSVASAEAVQMLNTLVTEYPRLEPAWGYLINWYLFNKQTGMAMDTVLRGLGTLPENRMLLMLKARIESERSTSVAMETLNQLARKYPSDEAVVEMRVKMMQSAGRIREAVRLLSEWLSSNPASTSVNLTLLQMELYHQNNDIDQAKQLYKQLLGDENSSASALIRWIRLIGPTANAEQILAEFQSWYDAHPQGGQTSLQLLENLLAVRTEQAVKAAEQILVLVQRREPDSPAAAYGMAMLRHMTGRRIEAIPLYERALQLQPDNIVAINNLAWLLSQDKGEHDKALVLAEKGLMQAPDYLDLIDTRGTIFFMLKEYEKAAGDFKTAADRYSDSQPQKAVSTYFLGKSLILMGKKDQARTELFRAKELDDKTGGLTDQQRDELAEMLR